MYNASRHSLPRRYPTIRICMNCTFSHIGPPFSSGRGSFLARSAVGHAGGPPVHLAQIWAPAGLRGARSGRSKSSELASNHGIAFRLAEPQNNGNPINFFAAAVSCLFHTVPPALKLSTLWQPRYNSSRIAGFLVTADGRSVYDYAMFPADLGNRNGHIISRGGIDWMLLRGQDDINPHFLPISKAIAQPRYTLQQQRHSSSTTAPALQTLAFVTGTVRWCSYVCSIHQEINTIIITLSRTIKKIKHMSSNLILSYSIQQYSEHIGTLGDDAPPFQLATPSGFQVNPILKGDLVLVCICIVKHFCCTSTRFSGHGSFLALSAAGHAGGPRVLTAKVWPPDGLRGACSGRSKSRELASNYGIAFRRARANQAHGNPKMSFFVLGSAAVCHYLLSIQVPHQP